MSTTPTNDTISIPRGTIRRGGLTVLAILVLVAAALGIAYAVRALRPVDPMAAAINSREYQYVSLTNGESYFGKLSAPGGSFYYMRHVYTLTAQSSPRSGKPLQRTLFKLTSEVHGPEDLLVINRSQIVYMENLKPNGCATILMTTGGPCK